MGDQYEVDSGADPENNDTYSDASLLLAAREFVDHSRNRRDTAGVDQLGLARATSIFRFFFLETSLIDSLPTKTEHLRLKSVSSSCNRKELGNKDL
jgi:hypothetical protein